MIFPICVKIYELFNIEQSDSTYDQATHAPLEAPVDEFRRTRATGNPERDVYRAMLARYSSCDDVDGDDYYDDDGKLEQLIILRGMSSGFGRSKSHFQTPGARKWDFERPNPKTETIFHANIPTKFCFMHLPLLDE